MESCKEKIERCCATLLMAHPWWATLLLHLRRVETDGIPTMGVDGTHLFINPKFALSLTDEECVGVLLHETGHIALLHCFRRAWRDPLLWNIAADECVNALLLADGITPPKNCVPPCPLDETAEERYEKLSSKVKKLFAGMPQDVMAPNEPGKPGSSSEASTPVKGDMTERDWRDALAANHGLEPAGLSKTLREATQPLQNWRDILARFISATHKADSHTWSRASRRLAGMPGWKREPESTIALIIDTSGSCFNESILDVFVAECRGICSIGGICAYVMDSDVTVKTLVKPGDAFPTKLEGGGGTSFIAGLEKAEELQVDAAIYFTDGDGEYPPSCGVPVLWALTEKRVCPFGESIYLKGE